MKEVNNNLWTDKKRYLGMKISFTRYALTEDQLFIDAGLFNLVRNSVKLYRVRDMQVQQPLFQRIFKCGYVTLFTSDVSMPTLKIGPILNPLKVSQLFDLAVDNSRKKNNMRTAEFIDDASGVENA